jgi:hypothetical protein
VGVPHAWRHAAFIPAFAPVDDTHDEQQGAGQGRVEAGEASVSEERVYQSLGPRAGGHVLDAGGVERVGIWPRGPALGVTCIARQHEEALHGERAAHRSAAADTRESRCRYATRALP